jgi:tetratricopeptide (TPR) repeat protein
VLQTINYGSVNQASAKMSSRWTFTPRFVILLLVILVCAPGFGSPQSEPPDALKLHFDAAGRYQYAGDARRAAAEYKAFLSEALHRVANGEAGVGRYEPALALLDEALKLSPAPKDLRLDYARVALDAEKLTRAKELAAEAVRIDPGDAQARFLLGRVLFHLQDYKGAREQLEAAVSANPDFNTGYLLGRVYLVLHEERLARTLFDEMIAGLGDTTLLHIYFGRAYSLLDYPEQAVEEFQKAMAEDSHAADAHYYLALAYLRHDESAGYAKAAPEFEAELKINPNDVRSHYMLGYIALKESRFPEAERELSQAAALQPRDLNTLVNLAEVYIAQERSAEAETMLRKEISLAQDAGERRRNGRAHYLLGRLLVKAGKPEEAKQEMAIAAQQDDTRGMSSGPAAEARVIGSSSLAQQETPDRSDRTAANAAPEEIRKLEQFKAQMSPVIAEAYNNLGALAASSRFYAEALDWFEKASTWNPQLEGLDRNLGMAAFYAQQWNKAKNPLQRYVLSHAGDTVAHAALEETLKRMGPAGP